MAYFQIKSTGNTIIAEEWFMQAKYPGDYAPAPQPAQHVTPGSSSAYDWYRKFTMAELTAIHTLAGTDSSAYAFLHLLEMTIAAGGNVVANDPDLIAGMNYLQANPSSAPCLTATRATQLMAII